MNINLHISVVKHLKYPKLHNFYSFKYLVHDLIAFVSDSFIVKCADGIQRQLAYDQIKPFETQCQCQLKLPSGPTV